MIIWYLYHITTLKQSKILFSASQTYSNSHIDLLNKNNQKVMEIENCHDSKIKHIFVEKLGEKDYLITMAENGQLKLWVYSTEDKKFVE